MNTVKTGMVVVVLLGVLYGVYRVLNMPDPHLVTDEEFPPEFADGPDIDIGMEFPGESNTSASIQPPPTIASNGLPNDVSPPPFAQPDASFGQPANDSYQGAPLPGGSGTREPSINSLDPGSPENFAKSDTGFPDSTRSPGDRGNQEFGSPERSGGSLDGLDNAWTKARSLIDEGFFQKALEELSVYYDAPGMSPEQQQELLTWLDALAAKVIYSTEDLLERPHIVTRRGVTLNNIAEEYQVPPQLLFNINRKKLDESGNVPAGTELKVVRGPFRAQVDMEEQRLTLFLGNMYAGRFNVTVETDPRTLKGKYVIKNRMGPRDALNPIGEWTLDLGGEVLIHGRPLSNGAVRSCISLSPNDAADVCGILSMGSQVEIRR